MEKKNKFMSKLKLSFNKAKLKYNLKNKNSKNALTSVNIKNDMISIDAKKIYVFFSVIIILAIAIVILCVVINNETFTLVKKNIVEYTTLANAYIIKDETIVEADNSQTLIPLIAEGKKVSKGSAICMYKNANYDKYISTLESMDNEILNLMQDIPSVYTSEIETIDNNIRENIKLALGQTSYVKMQEYINMVNELINKRAIIICTNSTSGNTLQNLIAKRNEYESNMLDLSNTMLSPVPGIVSYTTDGMEDILKAENISALDYDSVESLIKNKNTTSKIKIVNNFLCYLIARTDAIDESYLQFNKYYKIKIIENANSEVYAKLIAYSFCEDSGKLDLKFEIDNNIENLINLRKVNLEICWWEAFDTYVPSSAIFMKNEINYVTLIKYGKYIDVPVKVLKSNGANVIISNYTGEELENLNIESKYNINVYDKIILNQNGR